MLGRHHPARPRGRRRVLWRAVRLAAPRTTTPPARRSATASPASATATSPRVSSLRGGRSAGGGVGTRTDVGDRRRRDRRPRSARQAADVLSQPADVAGRPPMRSSPTRPGPLQRLGGAGRTGRDGGQRARRDELQRPPDPRPGRGASVLRRGLRLGPARLDPERAARGPCPVRRLPRAAQAGTRARMAEMGAPARFQDVVASVAASGDDQPAPPRMGRDLRRRGRRRHRGPRRRAGPRGAWSCPHSTLRGSGRRSSPTRRAPPSRRPVDRAREQGSRGKARTRRRRPPRSHGATEALRRRSRGAAASSPAAGSGRCSRSGSRCR